MKINWKTRAKNKAFWLTVIPAVLLLIQAILAVFGCSLELFWLSDRLEAVVNAAFVLLAVLGIVVDPTTVGIADSKQALTYAAPRKHNSSEEILNGK